SCQIGMRRNPVELGHDTLRGPRKVRRVRHDERGSTDVENLLQFLITPPWLRDVMIREETSVVCYEKSGPKKVKLQRWSRSVSGERYHPLIIYASITRGICSDTN